MVKFVVTGPEIAGNVDAVFGFHSFEFLLQRSVVKASGSGFTVKGGPFEDPSQGDQVYFGKGLKYKNITKEGITLKTPFKGMITGFKEVGDDYKVVVTGMEVAGADFYAISKTTSDKDNEAFLPGIFSGNDILKSGSLGDQMSGYKGNDLLDGRGGNDKLWGGNGSDTVKGGAGNDKLFGDKGKDILIGGNGRDKIEGGKGNDKLKGGGGADDFIFKGGKNGTDHIKDFKAGVDDIRVKHSSVSDFGDLTIKTKGGDAHITCADTEIILDGVRGGSLDADDFLF
jgi:Ca2+-binding RTX toxin-like protein